MIPVKVPHDRQAKRAYIEVRRLRLFRRWACKDPLTVLAPGTTITERVRLSAGMSKSESTEVSTSISLKGNVPFGTISADVSAKLNRSVTITEQKEFERSVESPTTAHREPG